MKKLLALFFAGLMFASVGCAEPVDKADEPVEEVDMEGVPPL